MPPLEKRLPENSKKIAETAGKNRKDTHRNQRSSKAMGEPSSPAGASKVSTPSASAAKSTGAAASKEVLLCDSSSSSSSGIGSSRLSSSGGSSDAVDNCDNGQSTAVVHGGATNEARRVPELHPEGGDDVASNGSRKSSLGGGGKEPLSRQASSNGGDDNSSPIMLAKSLSKKKRKKRLDKNGVTANGPAVSSRDCSPSTAVNGSSSRQTADKRMLNNPPHSSGSGSNKNNASNRFSCEAGPRTPKR